MSSICIGELGQSATVCFSCFVMALCARKSFFRLCLGPIAIIIALAPWFPMRFSDRSRRASVLLWSSASARARAPLSPTWHLSRRRSWSTMLSGRASAISVMPVFPQLFLPMFRWVRVVLIVMMLAMDFARSLARWFLLRSSLVRKLLACM